MLFWIVEIAKCLFSKRIDVESDAEWVTDQEWYHSVKVKEGVDYGEMIHFAEKKYDEICQIHDAIDEKAAWLFGVAFAASGGMLAGVQSWGLSLGWSSPAIIMMVIAMILALRTRLPGPRHSTMSIKSALTLREDDPNWKVVVIASFHTAVTGMTKLNRWKSTTLATAAKAMIIGAILFAVPVAIDRYCPASKLASDRHIGSQQAHSKADESAQKVVPQVSKVSDRSD